MTIRYRETPGIWDWLLRREVWRYTDGRVQLIGFSAKAAMRWHNRRYKSFREGTWEWTPPA